VNAARFAVEWTPTAVQALAAIEDRRVRRKVFERASALAAEPEVQGKALVGPLAGFRSVRAVGQRYRIIYRVERGRVVVFILAVGLRRGGHRADIYELARKLVQLGLTEHRRKEPPS
jgi:mRNA interferase RelE/StbE